MEWVLDNRRLVIGLICMVSTITGMVAHLLSSHFTALQWLDDLENLTRDLRVQYGSVAPRDPRLLYLAIDDQSVRVDDILSDEEIDQSEALLMIWESGWPFKRDVYGLVLDRLFEAGASLVVIDLIFPTATENDAVFAAALEKYKDRVVIGYNTVITDQQGTLMMTIQPPAPTLITDYSTDPRTGFVTVPLDRDSTVRSIQYAEFIEAMDLSIVSLGAATLGQMERISLIPEGYDPVQIRWSGPPSSVDSSSSFRPYPLWQIFVPSTWKANFQNGEWLRGKIVILGPSGNFLKDVVRTPYGEMPGPEVHMNAINAALQQQIITRTDMVANIILIAAGGALAWLLLFRLKNALITGFVFISGSIAYVASAQLLYNSGIEILVVLPLLTFNVFGVAGFLTEFLASTMHQRHMRRKFESFLGTEMAAELIDNPESYYGKLGGVRLPVTILFADVRGFTTMAEGMPADELVSELNDYLTRMARIVFHRRGGIDKYMGDAIMAVWGNIKTPGPKADALAAVHTALDMRAELRLLNQERQAASRIPWAIGIGIHQGEAVVGSIGSPEKMEATVIGDAVNLASRLEGQCKQFGLDMIFSGDVAYNVGDEVLLQSVGSVVVKGKSEPVDLYTALGRSGESIHPSLMAYLQAYELGIRSYRAGDIAEALQHFRNAEQHRPGSALAAFYQALCGDMINNGNAQPPKESWQGVIWATEK